MASPQVSFDSPITSAASPAAKSDESSSSSNGKTAFTSQASDPPVDSSFVDSGYSGSDDGKGNKQPTPSNTNPFDTNPHVQHLFNRLLSSNFPHQHKIFGNWFTDEVFPWLTRATFVEPSVRTIYLPRDKWYKLEEHFASCHQIRRGIIKLFYNLSQQHLAMSVTTPLHTESGRQLEEGINVVAYPSEQLKYTKLKAESSEAAPYCVTSEGKMLQQVADHKLSVVLRQEFRRLLGRRRVTRGAKVQPPPFSCEVTNVETSHSEHDGHVLHKAAVGSTTETLRTAGLMTKFAPAEVEGVVFLHAPAPAATSLSTLASPAGAQASAGSPSLRPPATSLSTTTIAVSSTLAPAATSLSTPALAATSSESSTLASLAGAQAQGRPRRQSTKPAARSPSPSPVRRSIKPEGEESEIFGIVPVIIINLQDSSMAKGDGKPVGCKMVTFTSADGILELKMAPLKDPDSFFGQLWKGDTLLTPERSAAMLVFLDREGLERLRKGVTAGWSADRFIEEGDGMHIVPDVPEAPGDSTQQSPKVQQEYRRMIPVWGQYVRQLRYMQCAYEKLAINVIHGANSDKVTAWLKDVLPRLKAQEAQLPEGVVKDDNYGLAYVVDLIAEGLAQAAEKMAVEKHQSSFSAQNSYPKVLLAAGMKRTHGDPRWVDIDDGHLNDGYQYLLEGTLTKKPRFEDRLEPPRPIMDHKWRNPAGLQQYNEFVVGYNVERDTAPVEAAQEAKDGEYVDTSTGSGSCRPSRQKDKGKGTAKGQNMMGRR